MKESPELHQENQPEVKEEEVIKFFQFLDKKIEEIQKSRAKDKPQDFINFYGETADFCLAQFPEFKMLVEAIFGIRKFVNRHDNLAYHRESLNYQQRMDNVRESCVWQAQATEALISFNWNKRLQDRFWREVGKLFDIFSSHKEDLEGFRRGVTGQARAFLILKELGYNPRLATPEEDAAGIDFHISWAGENEELIAQIKASSLVNKSIIEVVDVGSPKILGEQSGKKSATFQSHFMKNITHLRESAGDFSRRIGKQIRSLIIILSEKDFDFQTGRPTAKFIEKIKKEIELSLSK